MDDQLDNDLRDRIREVFDDFEHPSADEGWLLLREKFPEKQSKRRAFAWIWWGSAAAVLFIFLGIGLWIKNAQDKPKNNIVKILKQPKQENSIVKKTQKNTPNTSTRTPERGTRKTEFANNHLAGLLHSVTSPGSITSQSTAKLTQHEMLLIDTSGTRSYTTKKMAADSSKLVINKIKPFQIVANNETKSDKPKSIVIQEKKTEKSILAMFNDDKNAKTPKKEDVQSKKVRFAVYAATYFNYAKGSDNQVNIGAGFTSDIKISNNFKLVTGISIAQNSLSYSGFPSATASTKSNLYAPAAKDAMSVTALSAPTVKNYNASLVGLDIPINIKYEFNPQKSDAYIAMGLSSGTFIDESYTYKYNYPSFLSEKLQQPQNETTGKSFNSFYFAKTLNVAFGVGYPFGKNRLIIEPFLKYPLDGIGSQNLKFGAGGLNLKLNFQSSHK